MRLSAHAGPVVIGPDSVPVLAAEFEQWMKRLGPFESAPRIAVAVSGGRDSMALAILARDWAKAHGGSVHAVTIDHGLRSNSAHEAAHVGCWMLQLDIPHQIVCWETPEHETGIEAAARDARYALLEAYCREHGILHLLVGHHQADQQETQKMRRARGSGLVGLAGMAAVREMKHMRILRPLLGVPRDRITATLQVAGQDWVEDPSNQDGRFARARMRAQGRAAVATADIRQAGATRTLHEQALAVLASTAVGIDPAGFAMIDLQVIQDADADVSRNLFGNVVTSVSGGIYPPRGTRLDNLWARLIAKGVDRAWTLGGCIIRPERTGKICVMREPVAVVAQPFPSGERVLWDGRFVLSAQGFDVTGLTLDALGKAKPNYRQNPDFEPLSRLPKDVCATLPALFCESEIVAFPSFDPPNTALRNLYVRFAPQKPVSGAAFGNV